jgi:MFS family permease
VTAPAGPAELAPPVSRALRSGPLVQYALLAGPLLSMLDSSIVNVAVEPIARELHASLTVVQWTVSGYLLALGAGLAGTAFLARRFGTLPVYRARTLGPVAALHTAGLALVAIALAGALGALALPAVRNTAMRRT